jgi:peptide/nickel transport system substrate-binding protein
MRRSSMKKTLLARSLACVALATLLPLGAFAAPAPKSGGVLKVSTALNPKVIGYPVEIVNNGPLPFLDPVIQAMARFDAKGNLVPWLAQGWTVDAKAKTIAFKLRPGVKYSDGTAFDADSAKWNIGLYIDAKRPEVADVSSIDVLNPTTLRINLKTWNSSDLVSIGFFIRYISKAAFDKNGKEWCYKNAVGTGPFLVEKFEQNVSVTYAKNPNYWEKGLPRLDGIQMLIIGDAMTSYNSLKAGEVDGWVVTDNDIAKEIKDAKLFTLVEQRNGVGAVGVGLIPDCTSKGTTWTDVKARQALCYAIDEKTIANVFGKGFAETTNQWGSKNAYTFNPEVQGYPYNPEKAKQLLKEAGFGKGMKTKLFSGENTKDMAVAIQGYLAAVGIDAEVVVCDEAKIQSLYTSTWEGGLMFHFHSVQPDLGLYMNRHLDPNGTFYAKGLFHPEDVLALLKSNQQAADDKVKKDTSMKLQKLVYDKYCLVGKPLYIAVGLFAKAGYVRDDGMCVTHNASWTPETAWLDK